MTPRSPDAVEALSDTLEALFRELAGARPWEDFLLALRDMTGAEFATLILTPPGAARPGRILTPGAPPEEIERYAADFFTADPFTGLPEGEVTAFHDFVGKQAVGDPELRGWLAEHSSQILGVDIRAPSGFEARLRISRATGPAFAPSAARGLTRLVPHLRNALDLYHALEANRSEQAVYSGAIENLSVGVVLLDHEGRIVRANAVADAILASADGIARSERGLRFGEASHRARIEALLAGEQGERGSPAILRVARPSGSRDYGVAIHRIDTPGFMRTGSSPALALLISDPERAAVADHEALRSRFGLTRKEALLAGELAGGNSLDQAAARLGIARNTARSHLRALFAKTGVSRQGELVRLIHASLPGLAREP
jgi:DNA-binding CsgD family transcriptional regulator/PAS domain-containing protein